jgi:tetratricopeptide (TPR) repeat protein
MNNYPASTRMLERALALVQGASLRDIEADALRTLGFVCAFQGDMTSARRYLEQSLSACHQIANPKTEGRVLCTLGMVLIAAGDYAVARSCSKQALSIFREIGFRWGQGEVFWCLGFLSLHQGDYDRAGVFFGQQLRSGRETGNAERESRALADLGLLSHCLGDHKTAQGYGEQSYHVARRCGNRWYQAYALLVLGHARASLGQLDQAVDAYQQALALYHELNVPHWTTDVLAGLARVALARGERAEAMACVKEILRHQQMHPKLECTQEPLRVFLTCYSVLMAVKDPRAEVVLEAAYRLLQERAEGIEEEALRRSYVESVPYHREIVAAWEKHDPESGHRAEG